MTQKQNSLYWREWGAVVRHCKAQGLTVPDRHDLHLAALGRDKSHLGFSNEDLDKVLAQFRAHSHPEDLSFQLRQLGQARLRLKYAVNALSPSPEYWTKIARDKFGTADLDALTEEQLSQLRLTLASRKRSREFKKTTLSPCSLRGAGPEQPASEAVSVAC